MFWQPLVVVQTPCQVKYPYGAHLEVKSQNHRLVAIKRMLSLFELDPEKAYKTYVQLIDENLPILGAEFISPEQMKKRRLETLDTLLWEIVKDEENYQLIKVKDLSPNSVRCLFKNNRH